MSRRHRLGVALLLGPLRPTKSRACAALGELSADAIVPHLTLVPPVNVRHDDLDAAEEVLRGAASSVRGPLEVTLGPAATFQPASPVLYLEVGGRDVPRLAELHAAVGSGPLRRSGRWPWVPHVTLWDEAGPSAAAAAVGLLSCYRRPVRFDRAVLMEESEHRWSPLADAAFGPPAVVGRGGLEVELTEGSVPGPQASALWPPGARHAATAGAALVITARREGRVAGVAGTWVAPVPGSRLEVAVFVAEEARSQGVGRCLLLALENAAAQRGWETGNPLGHGAGGFFARSSAWVRDVVPWQCE